MSSTTLERWRRWLLLVLGWMLVAAAPIAGLLPGPGGIFLFAGGVVLLLRHSVWARRRYAGFKRRWPKLGERLDVILRRPSARRRRTITWPTHAD